MLTGPLATSIFRVSRHVPIFTNCRRDVAVGCISMQFAACVMCLIYSTKLDDRIETKTLGEEGPSGVLRHSTYNSFSFVLINCCTITVNLDILIVTA